MVIHKKNKGNKKITEVPKKTKSNKILKQIFIKFWDYWGKEKKEIFIFTKFQLFGFFPQSFGSKNRFFLFFNFSFFSDKSVVD